MLMVLLHKIFHDFQTQFLDIKFLHRCGSRKNCRIVPTGMILSQPTWRSLQPNSKLDESISESMKVCSALVEDIIPY